MKITKDYLKRIIKEELEKELNKFDSYPGNYYKTYFDFSGVEKVGNKLNFDNADDLNERHEEISIDDPGSYGNYDSKDVDSWSKEAANIIRDHIKRKVFKNEADAKSLMLNLLEHYRGSIEEYVRLINDVGGKVTFNYEKTKGKQASHILGEMIKLLSIGKRYEDLDY